MRYQSEQPEYLKNIKVGDRVWVGDSSYPRKDGIQTVSRLTNTLVILTRYGCDYSTEFDRYNRHTGYQTANLMWKAHISAVATPREVAAFEAEETKKAAESKTREEAKQALEAKIASLQSNFTDSNYIHVSQSHDSRLNGGEGFDVRLYALTEVQIVKLAELVKGL